jgi:hypothetical protein
MIARDKLSENGLTEDTEPDAVNFRLFHRDCEGQVSKMAMPRIQNPRW